jgi:ABC-type Co2+ transport system permease subunit
VAFTASLSLDDRAAFSAAHSIFGILRAIGKVSEVSLPADSVASLYSFAAQALQIPCTHTTAVKMKKHTFKLLRETAHLGVAVPAVASSIPAIFQSLEAV